MKLSDDARSAHISINRDLSSRELETLIVKLMTLRSSMLPHVPEAPPVDDGDAIFSCQEDGGLALSTSKDGRTRLLLRHTGFGWLAFTFGLDHACLIRDYLVAHTPDDHAVHLIGEEFPDGGSLQ